MRQGFLELARAETARFYIIDASRSEQQVFAAVKEVVDRRLDLIKLKTVERTMGFSEIVGHEKQIETLRQSLVNGRLHHAYLFVGPDGIGKRTLALALAQAIHCTELES